MRVDSMTIGPIRIAVLGMALAGLAADVAFAAFDSPAVSPITITIHAPSGGGADPAAGSPSSRHHGRYFRRHGHWYRRDGVTAVPDTAVDAWFASHPPPARSQAPASQVASSEARAPVPTAIRPAGPPAPPESKVLVPAYGAAWDAAQARYQAEARAAFTPESRRYAAVRVALRFVEPIYAILAALLLLVSGLSTALRDLVHRLYQRRYPRALVYVTCYSLIGFVLALPLVWFGDFALEHRFGLSTQSLGGWFGDQLKGELFEVLFLAVVPLVALGTWVLERWPRRGWLWIALGTVPLLTVSVWLAPLVVEPAFNRFQPLRDPGLKHEILALADRAGIPGSHVYEVDRSEQTTTLNAYVNGIGSSHRIVIWDTAIRSFRRDELLFVTGHEIGHYRLGHVRKGVLLACLAGIAGVLLTGWLAHRLIRRFGATWGVTGVADLAALPLLVAIVTLLSTCAEPFANAWSRRVEREADLYALELTRDGDAGARAFLRMAEVNRSDPDPPGLVRLLLYTHPTILERIRLAGSYHPWSEGRPARLYLGAVPGSVPLANDPSAAAR